MNVGFLEQLGKEYKRKGNYYFHPRTKSSCKISKPGRDVYYILGFLADGCLSKRKWKYEIEIYQKDKNLLNKISKMFEKNFNVKPQISWHTNAYRLRVCSKPLFVHISNLYESALRDLVHMEYRKNFIAGFLDAEGSLVQTKNGSRVAITQADVDVLRKISRVLRNYHIHSKVYGPYDHKNSRKKMHYLHIEGKHVKVFFRKIPSLRFSTPHTMTLLR
jgi:intein-encoded DNA endonuclease-like protein